MLTRIIADKSADLINLKISKVVIIFFVSFFIFCTSLYLLCFKYFLYNIFSQNIPAPELDVYISPLLFFRFHQVGGLTKARAVRDLAVSAGIAMNIEDTWGGDIVTAGKAYFW